MSTLARRQVLTGLAHLPLAAVLADPRLVRAAASGLQEVSITTAGGKTVGAALALPETTPASAVLLIHEWWGLNDQIKAVAAELAKEGYVASSIQFALPEFSPEQFQELLKRCIERGVELKWFGNPVPNGYTSRYDSWHYLEVPDLPRTISVLSTMCDMRIPLTFDEADCQTIAEVISATAREVADGA